MKILSFCIILFTAVFASNAQAYLLVNGSFEDNNVNSGRWSWFDSSAVNGWEGSNIEIWNNLNGVSATHGSQFIELNSHANNSNSPFSIFQTFDTNANWLYALNFDYAARRNANEAFLVELLSGTDVLFSQIMDDHSTNSWSSFSTEFTATGGQTTLSFTSITPSSGTLGNFIDNISVSQVSAPSALLIALLSGFGLVLLRRNAK